MSRTRSIVTFVLVIVAVPSAIGYVTGWLAGASQSPVTAAVLPLVFGLLGLFGFGGLTKGLAVTTLAQQIFGKEILEKLTPEVVQVMDERLAERSWMPASAAVGVLLFSLLFFFGIQQGIYRRVPEYPSMSRVLENVVLSPAERAAMYRFRADSRARNMPPEDYALMMKEVFIPVLTAQYPQPPALFLTRQDELDEVLKRAYGLDFPGSAELKGPVPVPPMPPPPVSAPAK